MSLSCVSNDFAYIFLCVETTVRSIVRHSASICITGCFLSPSSDFCEFRILLDFDSPALVLCEMPVEHVLLVHCHHIDEFHHFLLRIEVAAAVEVHTSPRKLRLIYDTAAWQRPLLACKTFRSVDLCRKELLDCLHCIVFSGVSGSSHCNALLCDIENIAFRSDCSVLDILHLRLTLEAVLTMARLKRYRSRNDTVTVRIIYSCDCLEYCLLI